MNRLHNKTAIITGAASGIGWATTVAFLRQGATVFLFDANVEKAAAQVGALDTELRAATAVVDVDVSNEVSVSQAVDAALAPSGSVDILVNSAAAQTPAATVAELPLAEWQRAFAVNVTGTFLMSQAVLPAMRASGAGSIIHVASQLGSVGMPGFSAYCASKGAIIQLTKTMALDHAAENIRVNSVSPGATLTERLRDRFGSDQGAIDALGDGYPIGRLGAPDEIANGIVYLASDEASFVTGSDLVIDGGYLAR